MKRITRLDILDGYRVRLAFDDGVEGVVDFSAKPRIGVYAAWQDYGHFRRARIGDAGELIWDEQIDFSANTLWLRITGKPPEALSPGFASPAVHA